MQRGLQLYHSWQTKLRVVCHGAGRSPSQFPDLANVSERGGHHNGLVVVLLVVLVDALYRPDTRVLYTAEKQHRKQ